MKWFLIWIVGPIILLAIIYPFLRVSPVAWVFFIGICVLLSIVIGWKIVTAIRRATYKEIFKDREK